MRRATLLVIAGVLALAGCGGGGGGGGTTALSKPEFIAQANALCKDYDARIGALGDPASIAELVGLAEQAMPIAQEAVSSLRALKAPEDLQARFDEYLATGDANIDFLTRLGEAAKSSDTAAIQTIGNEAQANADTAHKIAAELGLTECAKDG